MDDALTEQIVFKAVAPTVELPGLDRALAKLNALSGALDSINSRLSGLSTHSAFTRTQSGIADTIKSFEKIKGKGLTQKDVSEVLGFDPKDVRQYYIREQEKMAQALQSSQQRRASLRGTAHETERRDLLGKEKKLQEDLNSLRRTFEGQDLRVSGAGSASKFFYGYQKAALRNAKEPIAAMQAIFGQGQNQPAPGAEASPAQLFGKPGMLTIPPGQIEAILGPGSITLAIPASRIMAEPVGPSPATPQAAPVTPSPAAATASAPSGPVPSNAKLTPQEIAAWKNTPAQAKARRQDIEGQVFGAGAASAAEKKALSDLALQYHATAKPEAADKILGEYKQAAGPKAKIPSAAEASQMAAEHQQWQKKKQELLKEYDLLKPVAEGKEPPMALRKQPDLPISQAPAAAAVPPAPAKPAATEGPIPLNVPAARIEAHLGPGVIPLTVPTSQVQSVGGPGAHGGVPPGAVPPPAVPGAVPPPPPPSVPGVPKPPSGGLPERSGALLEEKITESPGKPQRVQKRELVKAGETLDTFYKEVDGALEPLKTVTTRSPLKQAASKLQKQIEGVKAELEEQLKLPAVRRDPNKLAALYRKQSEMMQGFVGTEQKPTGSAKNLEELGQGSLVLRTRSNAAKLEQKASQIEQRGLEQAINEQQGKFVSDFQQTAALRKALDAARQKGEKEEESRIQEQIRQIEHRSKEVGQFQSAGQKEQDRRVEMERRVESQRIQREQTRLYKQQSYSAADARLSDFISGGGRITGQRQPNELRPGSPRVVTAQREVGGNIETITVSYGKAEAAVSRFTKAQTEARKEGGYLAGDFVKNTAKVTLWAASVGVLYKSIELASHSLERLIELGPQVGRLEQIFKGVGGTAQQVAVDTMELAAQYGASTKEAMEASIQWARLGLNRVQINEAVRVSLMAANVAQIDALDATEKLQGVYQAYKLTIGELRGELGQIVAITNTYNVTTADMLDALSRVAAVAKQAGLPLHELQGLLGATIGGTAQTGANIGNMMKSVILALSNPELQQKLRMQFRFEPTTGGEGLKSMSMLLGDLYVKFNHLNTIQQQSFLFSIAGRTQASRLQAMLEGYIKAQVLAVNAQLHLNTAESENQKITATLRAQLHGLVAEWERFIFVQGNRGPVQAMTELSVALRNVLKLLSMPVVNTGLTGVLGLLAAGGIKSVMTGMSLKSGEGFVGRSRAHVVQALESSNMAMMAIQARAFGGSMASDVGTRQTKIMGSALPARSLFNPLGPEIGKLDRSLYVFSESMLRVGKSTGIASNAVRTMATTIGATTRALSVGFIAIREWLLPLAAVGAAIYGFNRFMEQVGASSEAAERRLAKFNDEAVRAAAAASAYAEAAQALNTVQRTLTTEKGFGETLPERRQQILKQSVELVGLYEPDAGKQEKIKKEYQDQLDILLKQNDAVGIGNLIQSERNKLLSMRTGELIKESATIEAQRRTMTGELERLKGAHGNFLNRNSSYFRGQNERQSTDVERQLQELGAKKVKNFMELNDAYEQQLAYDEKYKTALETQKTLWESIAEIYSAVNSNNPMERASLRINSLQAENRAIEAHLKLLDQEDQQDMSGRRAINDRKDEIQKQKDAALSEANTIQQIQELATKGSPGMSRDQARGLRSEAKKRGLWSTLQGDFSVPDINRATEEAKKKIDELQGQMDAAERGFGVGEEGLLFQRRGSLRAADIEKRQQNTAQAGALQNAQGAFQVQTQMQFGREEARREIAPFEVGRDETQKLLNRKKAIQDTLNVLRDMPQSAEIFSRELELQNQLYEDQAALRKRSYDVEKDIRQLIIDQRKEMEHSILGAGPGELLRKMAAIRMGSDRKMDIGQFMSLSPEMRRDVSMVDPRFDPRMIDLQRERQRSSREPDEQFNRGQLDISKQIAQLAQALQEVLPQRATYEAAKASVEALSSSASSAAIQLGNLQSAAQTLADVLGRMNASGSNRNAPTSSVGIAPRNPQSGGVGGGAGFLGEPTGALETAGMRE